MRNIMLITKYTVREAFSRKVFLMFSGVSLFIILGAALMFGLVSAEDFQVLLKAKTLDENFMARIASVLKMIIVVPLFGMGIFLSIFSASSFIPHLLEKGNIDLFLSKPVSRAELILGKYLGGLSVVFMNVVLLVTGSWFLIGIKFGVWDLSFLLSIPIITFAFAELYALIVLIGIITKSSVLAMMMAYLIFFVISPLLSIRENLYNFVESKTAQFIIDGFYYILPKTSELSEMNSNLAAGGTANTWLPLLFSVIFLILTIYSSIIIFSKKDF